MRGSSIAWFAHNPAVANLLMVLLLASGVLAMMTVRQESLPNVPLDRISITVAMPRANPALVETLLCAPIEQAVAGVEGLVELHSEAHEGLCVLQMDVQQGHRTREVLDKVRLAVQGVSQLPASALPPVVQELVVRNRVLRLLLVGQLDEMALYQLAQQISRDLRSLPDITIVDVENLAEREVALEVPRENLHRFRMTLANMAEAVAEAAQPASAGTLHGAHGDMLLNAGDRIESASGYLDLPVRRGAAGEQVRVDDLAQLHDGFARTPIAAWHDGEPAVALDIYRVGDQQVLAVADAVKEYLRHVTLPAAVSLSVWQDDAADFRERSAVLWQGGMQALLILLLVLTLFLGLSLAGWIALGIPVAMIGAVAALPLLGESVNTISLFAFILVLGIVVDDAIIVGERIHQRQRRGEAPLQAAIQGARQVARPVVFAVLTTALAFAPLLFLPGPEGALMRVIPLVALAVLLLSLVESLWILPAHLARPAPSHRVFARSEAWSARFNQVLDQLLRRVYRPLIWQLLMRRKQVVALFGLMVLLCIALFHSGRVNMVLFSQVEGRQVLAELHFPRGTSPGRLAEEALMLETSARQLARRLQQERATDPIAHVLVEQGLRNKVSNASDPDAATRLRVTLMLNDSETVSAPDFARLWRAQHGVVPDALSQRFDASVLATKPDIHIHLYHPDLQILDQMAGQLELALREQAGVSEIANSLDARRPLLDLLLTDAGRHAGLTRASLALQVQQAFEGIEVGHIPEFGEEVPVLLRLAESDSNALGGLEQLPIFLPDGSWAPLTALADIQQQDTPAVIRHYDRRRQATLTALVDSRLSSPGQVMAALQQGILAELPQRWPGASWGIAGKPRAINEFLSYLSRGYLLAMMAIFFVLTVLFGNYRQPVLVMSAIPFGMVGASIGHFLLGIDITLWSMVGVIAVSGVVVNDNLVLLDEINHLRNDQQRPLYAAVVEAGASRFRPILLTTVTTVLGVLPLILSDAPQARFLMPMAVSLAFGVLFATLVSLLLVPCLLVWLEELRGVHGRQGDSAGGPSAAVETAYGEGRHAAHSGLTGNPYQDEVLHAAWEAGYSDAAEELAA